MLRVKIMRSSSPYSSVGTDCAHILTRRFLLSEFTASLSPSPSRGVVVIMKRTQTKPTKKKRKREGDYKSQSTATP
jgi:hypothetical protein